MNSHDNDPRVTADAHGHGYTVHTGHGDYRVLHSDVFGWGIYHGPNLDMVFTPDGPVIGAIDPDDLIAALLDTTPATPATADQTAAECADTGHVTADRNDTADDDTHDDTDGM